MIAVTTAVALVAGCGGDDEPASSRPIQAGPATTSTTSAAVVGPQPLAPGPLAPGSYETVKFRPKLSLRVGEGWSLLGDAAQGLRGRRGPPGSCGQPRSSSSTAQPQAARANAPSRCQAAWGWSRLSGSHQGLAVRPTHQQAAPAAAAARARR
jgi:hypothetical protein